jgi:hypothetical protein
LGIDIITIISSGATLFYVKIPCCFISSGVCVFVAILGLFSLVASLDGVNETGFGKALEGWVIGAVCHAIGRVFFIIQEIFNILASSSLEDDVNLRSEQ